MHYGMLLAGTVDHVTRRDDRFWSCSPNAGCDLPYDMQDVAEDARIWCAASRAAADGRTSASQTALDHFVERGSNADRRHQRKMATFAIRYATDKRAL